MKNKYSTYGYKEGKAFEGVMPAAINKMGGVGQSDVIVKNYDCIANGSDALEVMDLSDAFTPNFSSSNVTIPSNYAPSAPIQVDGNMNVKLNGKKITAPTFTESNGEVLEGNTDSYGFWVKKGGDLVIEGNGEVVAQDAQYSMAIWADGGNVTIKGGTYRNGGDSCDLIYVSNGGNVVIEGGEFFPAGPASGTEPGTKNKYTALNVKDKDYKSGASNIVVKGGIFHNFDPSNNLSEGDATNYVAEGYKSVEIETDVWEVMPE